MIINDMLKDFIKDNILWIEQRNWYLVFLSWYKFLNKHFPDTEELEQLFQVLRHIYADDKNVNVLKDSYNYRRSVIILEIRRLIDAVKQNSADWKGGTVYTGYLINSLDSFLGLSETEIEECVKEAARAEQLTPTEDEEEYYV